MATPGRGIMFRPKGEDADLLDRTLDDQETLTDLTPLMSLDNACCAPINGRTFHPFVGPSVKGTVEKPDGGLRGYAMLFEFNKDERRTVEEMDKREEETGSELDDKQTKEMLAKDGCTIYMWHVLETVPKKRKPGVDLSDLSVVLPSVDADKFIELAKSSPREPWNFTSAFCADMMAREHWNGMIRRLGEEGAEDVTEVDEDTMTFAWPPENLYWCPYSLHQTVNSIAKPGQKRKREQDAEL